MAFGLLVVALIQTPVDGLCKLGRCKNLASTLFGDSFIMNEKVELWYHQQGSYAVFLIPALRCFFLISTMAIGPERNRLVVRGSFASAMAAVGGAGMIYLNHHRDALTGTMLSFDL